MPTPDKIDQLYDALKADGAVSKSRENFRSYMLASGEQGYRNRKQLYDALKADGAVSSRNYEEFRDRLGLHAVGKAAPVVHPALQKTSGKPSQPTSATMTDAQKQQMVQGVSGLLDKTQQGMRQTVNRMRYAKGNTGLSVKPAKLGQNKKVVERAVFNPASGKMEKRYLTESGNEYDVRAFADSEQRHTDFMNRSVDEELQEAYSERDRLGAEIEELGNYYERGNPVAVPGSVSVRALRMRNDSDIAALQTAYNKTLERITTLEAERDDNGGTQFWRGFTDAGTSDTWLMGLPSLQDNGQLLGAKRKLERGEELTRSERAMLDATVMAADASARYGKNRGKMYEYGQMAMHSLPFMLQFIGTGGGLGLAMKAGKSAGDVAAGLTANALGKWMLKQTGRALGSVGGAVAEGALMANTIGAAGTAGDIIRRYVGDATVDENGAYIFEGGKSLPRSVYEGEVASSLEYGSEVLGGPIDKVLGKVAGRMGLSKLTGLYERVSSNTVGRAALKVLEKMQVHSLPGEILEEEAGMFGKAALGVDNNFSIDPKSKDFKQSLFNLENHLDVVFGIGLSMGLTGAAVTTGVGGVYGIGKVSDMVAYRRTKHAVDKADALASFRLTKDRWEELREKIDGTPNTDFKELGVQIATDESLDTEEKKAALEYMGQLVRLRGFNLGMESKARQNVQDKAAGNPSGVKDNAEEDAANAKYSAGYDANLDARMDIATGLRLSPDDTMSQAAWDGVIQRIEDDADIMAAVERERTEQMQHKTDGSLRPATLKEKDSEGNDQQVYIVDGNVQMMPDGSMVDKASSDNIVVVYNPATGERKQIDPSADTGISSLGEVITAEQREADIERSRQEYVQAQIDEAQGTVRFVPGQQLVLPTGEEAVVVATDADGENITVALGDGTQATVQRSELQRIRDEKAAADYRQRHGSLTPDPSPKGEGSEMPQAGAGGVVAGAPADYTAGMELTIRDEDGSEKPAMVMGMFRAVSNGSGIDHVPDTNGNLVGYLMDGKPHYLHKSKIGDIVVSHTEERAVPKEMPQYSLNDDVYLQTEDGVIHGNVIAEENPDGLITIQSEQPIGGRIVNQFTREQLDGMTGNNAVENIPPQVNIGGENIPQTPIETPAPAEPTNAEQPTEVVPQQVQESVQTAEPQPAQPAEAPTQPTEQPTAEPMPVGEDGEEDWQATTPERAHAYIFNEAGLSRSEGNEFIAAQTQAAQSALVKAKSAQMPRVGTSIKKYNEAKAKRQEKIDEAQRVLDYWQQVRNIQNDIQRVENERRAADDAVRHDEAVAEAQAEYEARKQAEAERKAVGNENPMPAITEKWNNATKVDGHRDEIMLPDGTPLKGHYVLHESGASSPSHNPETWQKTDGFPMDANDNSVNDRDYERDHDAQEHTQSIARQYDQRALQSVPVVSNDGVVLSGNGRTMAGELAARDNTDGAYVNYLKEYAPKFGFTAEQVGAMQHPRVSFVPDEAMPYTAETFAKFNQQEMKSQNKTEQAVKLGKTVSDDSFKGIVRTINGYDTLGNFYNDAQASLGAIYDLHSAGVVPQAQLAEMVDGVRGQEKLSAVGREFLENILIGKAFESDPEVVRMLTEVPSMRQSVVYALGEIVDNAGLKNGYSLQDILPKSVRLVYDARMNGGAKFGDVVSVYARQGKLFADPDELQTVADFNDAAMLMLADVLNDSRVTMLKTTLQLYNRDARDASNGQADIFSGGGVKSREEVLRDVIKFINENYGRKEAIKKARAEAVERRKAESVQQDGTPPAVNSGSEDTGRNPHAQHGVSETDLVGKEFTLSDQAAGNGEHFYQDRNGNIDLVEISQEVFDAIDYKKAPLRLTPSMIEHMIGRHGKETGAKDVDKAVEFILDVMNNFDHVRLGYNGALIFSVENGRDKTGKRAISILLSSKTGDFYGIVSSGYEGVERLKKRPLLWAGSAVITPATDSATEPVTTLDAQQGGEQLGSASGQSGLSEGKMLWRTPKDATTASVEQQGLDYAQPSETETATKGSGITPQSTDMSPSVGEVSENPATVQEKNEKVAENQAPNDVQAALAAAEQETNTEPTEAQKEAGNYKKGHVKIDGYDVTIENPKGSVRSGVNGQTGQRWATTMQNTYGYIRGTEGVDGDHIDVFFSEDPSQGDVFVVDQVNKDGSFDEHKVMYGFPDIESARKAYLSNYEDGWQGLGAITPVSKEEFKKWIDSSHRKTKPFAEYSSVKPLGDTQLGEQPKEPTVKAGEDYVSAAERIARENEVKRTAAHFAEETQEEAAAFDKRVPEMDDEELLAYMREDGKGNINKAHHPSVYDEYDYRHGDEQLQSYDDTLVRLNESGTTLEQAEEMLANIQKDVSRLATEDRAMLLGQEEALLEYIAGLEKIRYDKQGNPVDADGNLILEEISSVDELKGEDFSNPTRNVQLPKIPERVDKAIGAGGKPLIIKKNIFEKNARDHRDLKPSQSREILKTALYTPDLYGQNQQVSRPYNYVVISTKGADGKNKLVLLEVNNGKENVEIVHWHYIRDKALETLKRQAEREGGHILILPSDNSKEAGGLSSRTLDLSSIVKGSDLFGNEQRKVKKSSSETKIEDVGEVLAGARKDMRREIAKSLANVTEAALVEKPFGKVYKKPDLKKAVESGALREKDAIFYEALFSTVNQQKPKVTQSEMRSKRYIPDFKTKAERWAADTFKQMEVLRHFMELDEVGRDAMMEQMLADRYPTREQELAEIEKRKGWNPDYEGHKYEWGEMTTPNPLWVTHEVMNRLGYSVGDKLDVPYGVVKANTSGTGYSIENLKGERASLFGCGMTLDEAIDRIVYLAKLKRGDADVSHPTQLFGFPATKSESGESGHYRVMWGRDYKTREFDSKDEADAFAQTKNGAYVSPIMETKRKFGYKVRFTHPLTGEKMFVDDTEFDTKEEAQAYFDGNFEKLNEATNAKLQEEREKKGEKKTLTADDVVHVTMVHSEGGWTHAVVIDKKYANNDGQVRIIKEGFANRKDAKAFADSVKDGVLKTVLKHKEDAKKIVYFDTGENSRIGEDYRNGKNVDAEDFMNTFGFRGVQFGNWTNQADRQMAVNQAYDAFMDMARLIGVSPKAMSLNGELGIAFGARGVGGFAAHYEPGEVVINLTKTQGAGSLAHEWWHALDNYFARRAGSAGDMVTDNRRIEMRDALRKAFNDMLDLVNGSDYAQRSAAKGEYWGRTHEITARLLAEWVDRELKKRGELNTFLSRGAVVERGQQHNYNVYEVLERLAGREPIPFEEYKELPESLKGIPYPSVKEVEQFGASLRHIFDTLEEQVDEETGNVMLYEPAVTYETIDGKKVVWRSLFDEMGVRSSDEVAMVSQHTQQGQGQNQVIAPSGIRLRKLKKGETCHVERVYEETKQFDFTGKEKVESAEDVAYIFRQLQNAAVENSFLVLVKDGRPTVIHLGVGSYVNVMAPYEQALVAYRELKPEQVYFVHNHPSGVLKASRQDQELLKRVKMAFGEDVVQQGIIIDTTSGKYGEFDMVADNYDLVQTSGVEAMPQSEGADVPVKVYQFSRQVFAPGWNPESAFKIVSSQSVAEFVSSHRLGEHKKMSFLVVNNSGNVVANVFLPWTKLSDIKRSKDAGDLLAGYVHQCGGVRGVLYGNYDYEPDDRAVLAAVGGRMRQLNAPLMDALHVEHSAYESGWAGVGEPRESYGVDARDVAQGMDDNNGTEVVRFIDFLRRGRLEQGESRYFHVGETGDILNEYGISGKITIGTSAVNSHHNEDADHLDENDWVEVIEKINEPVAITEYGDRGNSYRIYTIVEKNGKNICVGVDVNSVGRDVNITNIRTAFARDIANALNERLVYPHSRTELETAIRELSLRHNREVYPEQPFDTTNIRNNPETQTQNEENLLYRVREDEPPTKTGIGYKVFVLKDGKLYPPMVANPNGEATPVGVWLDADAAPVAGVTKTGRLQVKAGGKGTQGGSGKLAYRPGWHLGEIPYALQFNRMNPETGQRELFPANFVWAEVEYANDVDYQEEAMSYGMNASGKFQHSLAGLPRLPENGSYRYRTNPDPNTDPWVITGAMKVNRILKPSEVDAMVEAAGREPQQRQAGAITDEQVDALNREVQRTMKSDRDMMRTTAEQMGAKLNTRMNIIEDVNDITHPNKEIEERRRRSKGWFDTATGEVVIVLPNNRDVEDVAATIGHETVAHKGLRELVGEDNYNDFLDETYKHLRDDLKKDVDAAAGRAFIDDTTKNGKRAKSYGQHRRTAVDELFGRMAEKPFEEFSEGERTLWQKMCHVIRRLLDKFLGTLKLPKWFELGDNELRYMLWRSKERLERGKEHPIDLARDIVKREELGLTDEARYNMGDAPETFKARQRRAVENKGTVMPGLNGAQVKVVGNIPRHTYTGNIAEATQQAIDAAKAKYVPNGEPRTLYYNNFGAEFDYSISGNAIETVLSAKHQGKSVNKGVHLALAEHLDRVIGESIEVEEHPDRIKAGDVRDNSKINPDALMHRFYGVANIDGVDYCVMTLMKEENKAKRGNGIHSYEVQKIEVLDEETPNTSNGVGTLNSELEGYPLSKVIKDVGKTMEKDKNLLEQSKLADESTDLYRDPDETEDIWTDGSLGLDEMITRAAVRLSDKHRADKTMKMDAMRAICNNLADLAKSMLGHPRKKDLTDAERRSVDAKVDKVARAQMRFDQTTVKRVNDLARVLISSGYLNNLTAGEVKRLLSAVKNSVGHNDIEGDVQKVMDIMVDNQLKNAEDTLRGLEAIRGSKVDARGVEVQGELDPAGQVMMKAFKDGRRLTREALEEEIGKVLDRMSSESESVREDAENAYAGLQFALQYADRIADSEHEEKVLSDELKQKHDETSERDRATDSYRQYVSATEDAIRQNKIERASAYHDLVAAMTGGLRESVANARKFKENERRRVQDIHHLANSDMQGMELRGHRPDSRLDRWNENGLLRFGLSPLHTFDQFMRLFGRKNADGKGYLYDHFVRGYIDSADHEQLMKEKYEGKLEAKVKELFGTHKVAGGLRKVPYTYTSLYGYVDALPMTKVTYYDGAGKREYELSQAQLAYLYMVDKMPMGKATNRGMGVTEEVIEQIEGSLDAKLKEFADWVQEEFLVELGNECNEVHKRMFGANMANIENYFPFVRDKNSIKREVENGAGESMAERISTKTGAIIKRTPSVANWDMPNANFLDVLAKHVSEMCQWSSYAELNRDLGTLQSYNRFKQQVLGMRTIYGSGDALWKRFMQSCAIAGNAYEPKRGEADKLMVQGAKGVTIGKIAFRPFTALKQTLSLPAFFGEVNMAYVAKDFICGGVPAVKWAWDNLPNFRKRVKSRTTGDFRLSTTKYDKEKGWTNRLMKLSAYGMLPNIGVDAWTIALGAHGVYQTAKAKYLRQGYSDERAERRAVQDAELCFNKSQQSSEGAFMAPVQIDHTFASTTMMLFRTSSTSYTREYVTSVRNLKRMMSGEVDVDFMAKQLLRNAEIPTFSMLFDADLQRQVEGTLPVGHIYSLGMPGGVLQSAGFPDAPIELSSTRLAEKSSDPGHPFPIEALKGLVDALNNPVAVFNYGNNAMNVIVGLEYKGKHFLVGVHFNQQHRGTSVSDIRGLFPKDNAEWLNWISQGKARYLDHKRIKALIAQQRINLAEVDYLDLKDVVKVMKSFVNPAIPEQKFFAGWRAEDVERAREQARKEYRSGYIRNSVNAVMFGYILPWLWRIGGLSILLTLGDDEDDKVSEVKKASKQSLFGPLEGIAYGDVIADGLYVSANKLFGDGTEKFSNLGRTNPFLSDLAGVLRKLDGDQMAAVNDVLNMLVGMNTGVNLQTVSDWATAILDYSPDGDTSREVSLLVSRLLNAPQSQIEKIYFDEIGMSGDEALRLSPRELVERYAQYKVKREHFVTPWVWGDEALLDKKRTKAIGIVKERVERFGDDKLQDVFDGGDMLLRSLAGKEGAKRLGGTDSYGSPQNEYGQVYLQMRDYIDLAEDVMLQTALKKAKDSGDTDRAKDIESARRQITEVKKDLAEAPYTLSDGTEVTAKDIMLELRDLRKNLLSELGITTQQQPNR